MLSSDLLILGSSSPRREIFLSDLGVKIQKVKHHINENELMCKKYSFEENVKKISIAKNEDIYKSLDIENRVNYLLTADTLVWNSKLFFPKPKNLFEAKNMLRQLKNHTHFVTTAICLRKKENYEVTYETTKVFMKNFSDKYLTNYINSNDVLSKSGSYGIQDDKFNLVKSYYGCYNNVVGLPVCKLQKLFKKMNFRIYNEIVCAKHT